MVFEEAATTRKNPDYGEHLGNKAGFNLEGHRRTTRNYLADLETDSSVSRKVVEHIHPWVAGWDLGRGESEAITLALKDANARAVLDDFQARKCTALLQVDTVGSLGLLLMAKRRGLIDAVRPKIGKLIGAGLRIDFAILDKIYKKIGE